MRFGSALIAVGVWNFVSSSRPWPSGVRIIAMSTPDAVEPDDAVHPTSLDRRLALQLQTKFDEERDRSVEVVDDDDDVVHPLNRHGPSLPIRGRSLFQELPGRISRVVDSTEDVRDRSARRGPG